MSEVPRNIEDIYPLAATQETVLIRSLVNSGNDDAVLALHCELRGVVDPKDIGRSWRRVCDRHAALRTSVHWQDIERPVQVVYRSVEAQLEYHDLSTVAPGDRPHTLDALLETFRAAGINLGKAPTARLLLARTGERKWLLSLLCHHVLLDGWSAGLIINDLLNGVDSGGEQHIAGVDFKRFVKWLDARRSDDIGYWRRELSDVTVPCLVGSYDNERAPGHPNQRVCRTLERETVENLHESLRSKGITESTFLAGAWGLTLSAFVGARNSLFGLTTSGRPPQIAGIDKIAGHFTRSVPIKTCVDDARTVDTWLQALQRQIHNAILHQYCSPAQIASCFGAPIRSRPFDTLLTIENYPVRLGENAEKGFEVARAWGDIQSAYPLTVVVIPNEEYRVELSYNPDVVASEDATRLADLFCHLLRIGPEAALLQSSEIRRNGKGTDEHRVSTHTSSRTQDGDPSSGLELKLLRIWQKVLGSRVIGLDDDFFDVGGTSVLAAGLFNEIERTLGHRLPLAVLIESPTIRGLAALLQKGTWSDRWRSLVPIQTSGDDLPTFCVHAQGGNVLAYRWLAEALGSNRPFYALQSLGLNEDEAPLESIEQMAEHYLGEIRTVQASGPYILMGHCFGSKVAFEMAQQLKRDGEDVALLCVLDSEPPVSSESRHAPLRVNGGPAGRIVRAVVHLRKGNLVRVALNFVRQHTLSLTRRGYKARLAVRMANRRAARRYQAESFDGDILVIRASEGYRSKDDNLVRGWTELARKADIHVVPGSHRTLLLMPHVAEVARIIVDALGAVPTPSAKILESSHA